MFGLFSSPPVKRGALQPSIGAESGPYAVEIETNGDAEIAIYYLKASGQPVWAYAKQVKSASSMSFTFEIWLYLAQPGIPIFSVSSTPARWTNVSKYVAQSATAADATLIESVDVSKGGVLKSGNSLYASDALGISEVQMTFDLSDDVIAPFIHVKAAKGLARTIFTPYDIYSSIAKKFDLSLTPQESKDLPPPPIPPTPPTKASATKASDLSWFPLVAGLTGGAILWAHLLRRK